MKGIRDIVSALAAALKEHQDPCGIALGVAIGSFIAVLPLYGLHTVLCIVALFVIPRANKLAILLGTNISLPLTVPTITWTAYDIGRMLLADKHYPPLSMEYIRNFKISKVSEFYFPLFVGSVALGLLVAVSLYIVVWAIANQYRKKHAVKK